MGGKGLDPRMSGANRWASEEDSRRERWWKIGMSYLGLFPNF